MEASVSGHKTHEKDYKNKVYKRREDRISGLPNDILVRILSLLPTMYAVRTSLLSKRWNRVWASVPILVLKDCKNNSNSNDVGFMKFVDRVLLLHDLPSLYKFSLECNSTHDPSRINSWISTALKRNVQELHLCIEGVDTHAFPRSLFISDTLTILKIDSLPQPFSNLDSTEIKIPTIICLPNLKVLCLDSLGFSTHQPNQHVSFNFPMLQKFELCGCRWFEIESVEIVAPALERLTFHDYVSDSGTYGQDIKVYAESLESLELISECATYLILCNLNSLTKAFIYVSDYFNHYQHYMTDTFQKISKVNHLTISDFTFKFISQAENQLHLLNFSNLVHLEVDVAMNSYYELGHQCLHRISSELMIDILCLLPTVKHFQFHNYKKKCALRDFGDAASKVVSQGSLEFLKLVELKNFRGSKSELVFVKDLLNNARALNEMSIISRPGLQEKDLKKHTRIAKKLLTFPRESNCVIHFS